MHVLPEDSVDSFQLPKYSAICGITEFHRDQRNMTAYMAPVLFWRGSWKLGRIY